MGSRGRRHQDKTPRFEHRVNERIRCRAIQVIDETGTNLGEMHPREATQLARERKLDLVEMSPNAHPPVCKMLDYGKWRYERDKRRKAAPSTPQQTLREVKMRPKIGDHDLAVKTDQVERLLNGGDRVKVTLRFRGREVVHKDLAQELMAKVKDEVKEIGTVIAQPSMQGRTMIMVLAPS